MPQPIIENARELLKENHKILDVALLVGYQDTAHFNRAFKEVTGLTPSVYRKEMGKFGG